MKRFLCALWVCVILNPLTAIAPKDARDTKNSLRILELLPNLLFPLAIEPAIPSNFVALAPEGDLNLYDWIYWGPKDVLMAYFKDPKSLNEPILKVKLSSNVAQTGPNTFSDDVKEIFKIMKKEDRKWFSSFTNQWGSYPILGVQTKIAEQILIGAWVGLNDPDGGVTLMFNLVYPDKKGHPNGKDRALWENFMKKTTLLTDGDYFKVSQGQDLQPGYTIVNFAGAKLKMLAEKRQRDGTVQVVVMPEGPGVEFNYTHMAEGFMGAQWKYGEPLVKVYGSIVVTKGNSKTIINQTTSIFVETVAEFSVKAEDLKDKNLFVYQSESDRGRYESRI